MHQLQATLIALLLLLYERLAVDTAVMLQG
jgi:hypothetical protein